MDTNDLSQVWRTGTRHPAGVSCVERVAVVRAAREPSLPASERERLADHIGQCAECADAWRLARDLAPAFAMPARRHARWQRWLPAAALVALTTGLAVWSPFRTILPPSEVRGSRSAIVTEPVDGAILTGRPPNLAIAGAPIAEGGAAGASERYEFAIVDARATELWTGTSSGTPRIEVPATLELPPGTYYWRVTAVDRRPVWVSELVRFDIHHQ